MRPLFVLLAIAACGSNGASLDDGELNGHCYPNGTCNVGLSCVGGLCLPADAAVEPADASPDAATCTDACEPNNTLPQAYVTGLASAGSANTKTLTGLAICPAGDVDDYAVAIDEANTDLELIVDYAATGDPLSAAILNSSGIAIANAALVGSPARRLRAVVTNLPAGVYYSQVFAASGQNDYSMTLDVLGGCVNAVSPAPAKHTHADDGTSKQGQACLQSGCHLTGGTGPTFSFAGTVYTSSAATSPKPGATVKVTFGSTTVAAVTDEDGNFYSTQSITLPATTLATACPAKSPMVGQITAGGGNCNNCHRLGGTTDPVHLP